MGASRVEGIGRGLRALWAFALGDDETGVAMLKDDDAPPGAPVAGGATRCRVTRGCTRGPDHAGPCVLARERA